MTSKAVSLLSSRPRFLPFAMLWLVHSGDASRRSTRPIAFLMREPDNELARAEYTVAFGKLSLYASVARRHLSSAPTGVTPARSAPLELPPIPQNRSNARICFFGLDFNESFASRGEGRETRATGGRPEFYVMHRDSPGRTNGSRSNIRRGPPPPTLRRRVPSLDNAAQERYVPFPGHVRANRGPT